MQSFISIFIIALGMTLTNQPDFDYDAAWKEVDSFIDQNLPKSAMTSIKNILTHAKDDKNQPQWAKAVIMYSRMSIDTEEDGMENSLRFFEIEKQQAPSPLKQVLASYLAQLYQNYYDNHQYEVNQRTQIIGNKDENFRLWTKEDFHKVIESLYLESIQHQDLLNRATEDWKILLESNVDLNWEYRPTLFELLADRVFEYFNTAAYQVRSSFENNVIKSKEAFLPVSDFLSVDWLSKDNTNISYQILNLYQMVLKHETLMKQTAALADYDLKRLEYVSQHNNFDLKSKYYIEALENLSKRFTQLDYNAEILSTLAIATQSVSSDSMRNVKAVELCEKVILQYPNSSGASKCIQLKNSIVAPSLSAQTSETFHSKQDIKVDFLYKNIQSVDIYIIKTNSETIERLRSEQYDNVSASLLAMSKTTPLHVVLKSADDFMEENHSYKFKNPGYGLYALVFVGKKDQSLDQILAYSVIHISDLSLLSMQKGELDVMHVVDRWSGDPLKNVTINLYESVYRPQERRSKKVLFANYTSNKDGQAVASIVQKNLSVELINKNDTLDLSGGLYHYDRYQASPQIIAEIYTDRSIYRPGQTVYFKGIVMKTGHVQIPVIVPNKEVKISFFDANGKKISSQNHTSNTFGSFNGHFTIPQGLLTGNFSLSIEQKGVFGQKDISVEEYKRPTFQVEFDSLKDVYKIGDVITIKGKAETFAGTPVDFAQVNYTVSRISRIPWYFEWNYIKPQEARLDVGQVTTDEKGEFEISFELVGDDQFSPESNPSFTFQTNVTITDSRGETREGKQFVRAAYKSHYLSIKTDQNQDMSDLDTIQFDAFNFADISINASALLKIEKLNEPKNVDWSDFDTSIDMPKRQKRSIIYQQQREIYENWPVEKVLLETKIDLPLSWFGMQKFTFGVYKITLMDASDKENKVEKFVVITNAPKNQFPIARPIHFVMNKRAYKPGESLHITLGNATNKSQFIQLVILKDNEILYESNVVVGKKREITFPILEKYRGDIFIKLNYVLNNRYFSEEERVEIPWNNKMIDIAYITFRDKCLPGAKESYQLKIKGKDKDAVFAEVLASMYDASLDQFKPNIWNHEFYPKSNNNVSFFALNFMKVISQTEHQSWGETVPSIYIHYPTLIPLYLNNNNMMFYSRSNVEYDGMAVPRTMQAERLPAKALMGKANDIAEEAPPTVKDNQNDAPPLVRKNLKETVFFYPDLTTDEDGNLTISYTMNDALTQWKMMILSHTADLKVGYDEKLIQTQKNVMVFPNSPRFLRDGDQISFKSKVTNLTNQTLNGNVKLQFFDALTAKDITSEVIGSQHDISAYLMSEGSATVSWQVHIPELKYSVITYRVTADFGEHIDIEENTIPILTNKMLVTETMPFWLNGNETKKFEFQAFKQNTSTTKTDFKYTVELTSHPIWYAIQAMPYMQLQNNNNIIGWSDQFYTNTLASFIVHKHPRIKSVFDSWQVLGKDALLSNLSKNEELKSAILQETPWVQDALDEEEQKRNIALLFDLNLLAQNRQSIISKIKNAQLSNGGFPWFAGGRDDLYTTMYIVENYTHMIQLGIIEKDDRVISETLTKATNYIDSEILNRYNRMAENVKKYGGKLEDDHLDEMATLYIYLRSMQPQPFANEASQKVYEYYITQAAQYWNKRGIFSQANIGLALNRAKNQAWKKIKASLDERAMNNAELGQYWNEGNGFRWYQLPIERHARLIEFYIAVGAEPSIVNKMKLWLLKNKQTNAWKTSKATAAALFALLINGEADGITSLINEVRIPSISVGGKLITKNANEVEAGTGYFKESFLSTQIDKSLSSIQVSNPNNSVVWGAAYYQYFETLDHIRKFDDTPLKISKKYFKLENGEKNDVLHEVTSSQPLKIGDRVSVRITMICDRDMEYVQLKDLRPSGFEPTNVLSGYKYQAGLSYYEATTDLATNFYFNVLPKGTYVFEYKVVVNHSGEYTSGITSGQCMYAPEFSSHSQGTNIKISE